MLDSVNLLIDTHLEKLLELFQSVPGFVFVFLVLIGLSFLIFGLRVYKVALGVLGFVIAGVVAYHFTHSLPVSAAAGAIVAVVAIIVQFVFMLVVAGVTFGAVTFAGMAVFFRSDVSILAAATVAILGVWLATRLFRFIMILTTSAIGSAAVVFSLLVLRDHGGIPASIDLTAVAVDDFQMAAGFAGLLLVGVIVQYVSWGVRQEEQDEK